MALALVSLNHSTLLLTCSTLRRALVFSKSLLKLFLNFLFLTILSPRFDASSIEIMYSELATHYLNLYFNIILLTIFLTLCSLLICLFEDLTAIAFCLFFWVLSVFYRFWLSFYRSSVITASCIKFFLSHASFHLKRAFWTLYLWRFISLSLTLSIECFWYFTFSIQTCIALYMTSWCLFIKFLNS